MTGQPNSDFGRSGVHGSQGLVKIRCAVDSVANDLDVDWTRGAIFEFESVEHAERWLEDQNRRVRGTLFLSRVPEGEGVLSIDYYVKYSGE